MDVIIDTWLIVGAVAGLALFWWVGDRSLRQ